MSIFLNKVLKKKQKGQGPNNQWFTFATVLPLPTDSSTETKQEFSNAKPKMQAIRKGITKDKKVDRLKNENIN